MDMNFAWTTRAEKLVVVTYWWEQQKGCCCICSDASIEHLIPRRENGPNTAGNVRLAHRSCNNRLGAEWAIEQHQKLIEAGLAPRPKLKRNRPAYAPLPLFTKESRFPKESLYYDAWVKWLDEQAPSDGQQFVPLDKKLVSLPRGATLLPTYKGRMGNVPRLRKVRATAVETARWLAEQGVKGA
jgi:hypothetical protein